MGVLTPSADDPHAFVQVRLNSFAPCTRGWQPNRQPRDLQVWVGRFHDLVEQSLVVDIGADREKDIIVPCHKNHYRIKNTTIRVGRYFREFFYLLI